MNKYFLYIFITVIFISCKPLQKIKIREQSGMISEIVKEKVNIKRSDFYFCDKINIRFSDEEIKNIQAKIFISTGKFIFVSVSFLGIEIGRAQISEDSIKYINRLKREYYFGNIKNLTRIVGMEFEYSEVENLLIKGLPLNTRDNIKTVLHRFNDNGSDYVYHYGDDVKRFIKVYFKKIGMKEYRIEVMDHINGLYLVGVMDDYRNDPLYPGSIKVNLVNKEKKMDFEISIGKIENKDFSNTSFKINTNYNELVF